MHDDLTGFDMPSFGQVVIAILSCEEDQSGDCLPVGSAYLEGCAEAGKDIVGMSPGDVLGGVPGRVAGGVALPSLAASTLCRHVPCVSGII